MVEVYAVNIHQPINNGQKLQMLSYISESQRHRYERFYFEDDKKRFLYGNVLSRYFVGKKLNQAGETIEFDSNPFGKPYVKGFPFIHFNISHSGEWVVFAIGNSEVGVDIEQIKPTDMQVARRFFTQNEYKTITATREEERLKAFYLIWTMKESYIKYLGKGLSIQLDSFEAVKTPTGFTVAGSETEIAIWQSETLSGYMLSLCHTADDEFLGMQILEIEKLIHKEFSIYPAATQSR